MATDDAERDLTPWEVQRGIFDDAWPFWRSKIDATDELVRFLHGERYADDQGEFVKDRRGIQIVGQETSDTVNHVVAMVTQRERNVQGRPIDDEDDPDVSEAMVALINNELDNPAKGFNREEYMALQACREGRRGVVWMDKVDNFGPFGSELFWSYQPNGSVIWDPAYHPHHPLCQWVIRHKRMDYREANRVYGVTWLRPDHESLGTNGAAYAAGVPLVQQRGDPRYKDNRVTIRELWIKNDATVKPGSEVTTTAVLKPADRFMQCTAQCGYRSRTQGALKAAGAIRKALPEDMPGASAESPGDGCPGVGEHCGAPLERIDARDKTQAELMYAKGRRMIVVAPFCPGPEGNAHLYDGNWPIPTLRSFPGLFLFASVKPGDNSGGPCDVDRMWRQQVASDNMMTLAVQRVFEHRDYWIMSSVGYYNAHGDRFEFRDDDENVIFQDMSKTQYGPPTFEHVDGTGLDAGWMPVYQTLQGALLSFRPKADITPKPGETRNVPVGTTEMQIQQSETTTEDFLRRVNQERGMWYGVVADGIIATYTPERISRLAIDGTDHLIEAWGDALPNMDYVVQDSPPFTGLDKARADAFPALMNAYTQAATMGLDPLAAVQLFGEMSNVPRSSIRKFVKLVQESQAAAEEQAAMMGGAPGGMDPAAGSSEGLGNGAPLNDTGTTAAGIPSAVAA